jgi:hypothetical protein
LSEVEFRFFRQVAPRCAGRHHPEDRFEHATIDCVPADRRPGVSGMDRNTPIVCRQRANRCRSAKSAVRQFAILVRDLSPSINYATV